MKCLLNPISQEVSELHTKLYDKYGQDKADTIYNMVNSKEFKKLFGDWTNENNHKVLINRIEINGEPNLETNSFGNSYFTLKNGKKYFINNRLLNFDYKQRKALISTSLAYLLEDDVTSKNDIEQLDFSGLYKEGDSNYAYSILNGDNSSLNELENMIRQYIGLLAYKNDQDKEDLENQGSIVEGSDTDRLLDLRQSFEKNSKDNATSNIKFLLSFVPEINNNNELVTIDFELEGGEVMPIPTYYDYNELWTMFEETLAGMYPSFNGGYAVDLFESMREKMLAEYSSSPTIVYLASPDGLLSELPPYKKNQFVQAFLKTKVNFYSTTIDSQSDMLSLDFFNSGDVTSRAKKVKLEIFQNIQHKSNLINNEKNTANIDAIKKISDDFESKFIALQKLGEDVTLGQGVNLIRDTFKLLGVSFNEGAIANYIESLSNTTLEFKIEAALKATGRIPEQMAIKPLFVDKKFNTNILQDEKILRELSKYEAKFRKDIAENTVLGANNKKYWTYSLPNYLNVKLDEYQQKYKQVSGAFYNNSKLLKQFADDEFLEDFQILTFLNLRRTVGDDGVDNKTISQNDQFIDMLNKAVMKKGVNPNGSPRYTYSIFNTLAPADKGRMLSMKSNFLVDTKAQFSSEGFVVDKEVTDIYKGYLMDEYDRISEAYQLLREYQEGDDNTKEYLKLQMFNHYHYKNGNLTETIKGGVYDGKEIPLGNAFKFTLFEELNVDLDNIDSITDEQRELFNTGTTEEDLLLEPVLTDRNKFLNSEVVNNLVNQKVNDLLTSSLITMRNKGLVNLTESNGIISDIVLNNIADKSILSGYSNMGYANKEAALQFIADSLVNQHIYNIEYTKLFTGDYAYYKNLDDFSKRIPATYIDGVMLNLKPGDSATYNMVVLPEVLTDSIVNKGETGPNYKDIDNNDAQGYITLARWKFLMERLNKWSPSYDAAYERMEKGTSTAEDHQYTAQPLKGVYFNLDNGVPTFVKYSQAVLIPKVVKGSGSIENLYNNMVSQGIDEAVVLSGVKVGAVTTSDVLDSDGEFKAEMKFYPQQLQNKAWRLQQDLTPKGVHPTLLGSQIKKNIIQNIEPNKSYNGVKGRVLIERIESIYTQMSNNGLQKLSDEIGLQPDGTISNREKFGELLLEEAKRNSDINIIEAMTNEYDLDTVVNNKKYQPLIASMINSATIRIKTHGATYIQMSAHGWGVKDATKAGVKMLVDTDKLKPPRVITRNGRKVVLPGQVFVTHSQIAALIPDYEKLSMAKLNELIGDKLRHIVGYRIPNQDLASSDALEIVGILPESMGDTMIPYVEITKKTGSDFDIDKMYAMLPNLKVIYESKGELKSDLSQMNTNQLIEILTDNGWLAKDLARLTSLQSNAYKKNQVLADLVFDEGLYTGKITPKIIALEYLNETNATENDATKLLENQLLENYIHILTSPEKYADLTNSLDNNTLKDDIYKLFGSGEADSAFNFFGGIYQLEKKFSNAAGKAGTGIASNHLVDQTYTQISNFTMNADIGVGNVVDGVTRFDNIYDTDKKNKISQVLSWFLTAYVDIAKDPYITRGNYNTVTADLSFMLLRAGTPLEWVNRYIGQPILKQYSELELNRDSKIMPTKFTSTFKTLKDELEVRMLEEDFNDIPADMEEYIETLENLNIRNNTLFSVGKLEKELTTNNAKNQYAILIAFERHLKLAKDFGQTVTLSKADVNGAKPSLAENLTQRIKLELLLNKNSESGELLFPRLANKFNTYLGVAQSNSIDLANRIYSKEYFTGKNKIAFTKYITQFVNKPNATKNIELVESMMNAFNISRNSFFNIKKDEMDDLLKGNLQQRVMEAKAEFPNNVFLQILESNTEDDFHFIDTENVSNKPSSYKNDIIKGWEDLFEDDIQLAEDLVKYSFVTSGFKFGMKTFYEYIPAVKYKGLVESAYLENNYIDEQAFAEFFYKHYPELAPQMKLNAKEGNKYVDNKLYGNHLLELRNQKEPLSKYYNITDSESKVVNLYKQVVYDDNKAIFYYARVSKLGLKVGGRNIIEPSTPKQSIIDKNIAKKSAKIIDNLLAFYDKSDIINNNDKKIIDINAGTYNLATFTPSKYEIETMEAFKDDPNNCRPI